MGLGGGRSRFLADFLSYGAWAVVVGAKIFASVKFSPAKFAAKLQLLRRPAWICRINQGMEGWMDGDGWVPIPG